CSASLDGPQPSFSSLLLQPGRPLKRGRLRLSERPFANTGRSTSWKSYATLHRCFQSRMSPAILPTFKQMPTSSVGHWNAVVFNLVCCRFQVVRRLSTASWLLLEHSTQCCGTSTMMANQSISPNGQPILGPQ